jgi:hypothetical protein
MDDGTRSIEKLERIDAYLKLPYNDNDGAKLHGMASLCAQAIKDTGRLKYHAGESLKHALALGEPNRLSGSLILYSLTASFEDAKTALHEAVEIAEPIEDQISADSVMNFYAWHLAVRRNFSEATTLAVKITKKKSFLRQYATQPTMPSVLLSPAQFLNNPNSQPNGLKNFYNIRLQIVFPC